MNNSKISNWFIQNRQWLMVPVFVVVFAASGCGRKKADHDASRDRARPVGRPRFAPPLPDPALEGETANNASDLEEYWPKAKEPSLEEYWPAAKKPNPKKLPESNPLDKNPSPHPLDSQDLTPEQEAWRKKRWEKIYTPVHTPAKESDPKTWPHITSEEQLRRQREREERLKYYLDPNNTAFLSKEVRTNFRGSA